MAGGGTIKLGRITHGTPAYSQSIIIGAGGTGAPGTITLDGGVIAPGLEGDVGTLSITTEAYADAKPIPVTLTNGTFQVDLAGSGVSDVLSTMTNVNINAGGNLVLDVDVSGFKPVVGEEWTIITSVNGPIADGNGRRLFDRIVDNSDRVDFLAQIAEDGKSVVLTAVPGRDATIMLIK